MYYAKAMIQYDGSNYAGFQWQKNALSIQEDFNRTLQKCGLESFTTMGASRTDSGVHALEQVVRITSSQEIDGKSLLQRMQNNLPPQIRILNLTTTTQDFRPANDSLSKEYCYLFTNRLRAPLEERKYVANISNPLDLEAIKICLNALQGEHDFCNFFSTGSNVTTTIRTLKKCELKIINPHEFFQGNSLFPIPHELNQCFEFSFEANGFLKQMIRHMVAGLWRVGSGKMKPEEFIALLDSPRLTKQLWRVASPSGLYLCKINYKPESHQY